MTYEFWALDGRFLCTIETDDPQDEFGEVARDFGVDADEVIWEEVLC